MKLRKVICFLLVCILIPSYVLFPVSSAAESIQVDGALATSTAGSEGDTTEEDVSVNRGPSSSSTEATDNSGDPVSNQNNNLIDGAELDPVDESTSILSSNDSTQDDNGTEDNEDGDGKLENQEEPPVVHNPSHSIITLGGSNRYETSAIEALYAFPQSDWAIIATAQGYADSICASGLAGALECPIILCDPSNLVDAPTANTLRQMGVKHVIILGSTKAISSNVEQNLRSLVGDGGSVTRLGGTNRYETQMAVYNFGLREGLWDGNTAAVATATDFADALAISPVCYKLKAPVFFTSDSRELPTAQINAIRASGFDTFFIAGSNVVVSDNVARQLGEKGSVVRLSGVNRYETSISIARYAVANLGMSWDGVAFASGTAPYDALGGGPLQGAENSVLIIRNMPYASVPWSEQPSYIKFLGDDAIFNGCFKLRIAENTGWTADDIQGISYKELGGGWFEINGQRFYRTSGDFVSGWQTISGSRYYFDTTSLAMRTGWVSISGVPHHFDNNGRWVSTHYHNIAWAGQPNNIYCGPTAGYMILRNVGAGNSRYNGASLTINNVAVHMDTSWLGYTSFNNRKFQQGMNRWLGRNVYSTVELPSYATVRNEIQDSFRNGYAVAFDAHERRGGPHYNNHNNSTFSHIVVVDGYNQQTDQAYIVDPGAGRIWGGAAQKFWYSLSSFVSRFVNAPDWGYRDGIGMYYSTL